MHRIECVNEKLGDLIDPYRLAEQQMTDDQIL